MGGGPPEGRGPRRAPDRPWTDPVAAPGAVRAPGCSGGTGAQEAPGETRVLEGSALAAPVSSAGPRPRAPPRPLCASPPCAPCLCTLPQGKTVALHRPRGLLAALPPSLRWSPPAASLRSCAPRTGPLRVPVSLCAGQARWWARTAPCCPSEHPALHQSSLSAPCLSAPHTPPEQVNRAPRPALCRRVPQAIAGLCAVQERRAGWSPRAGAARRRGTGLGRAAGRGARRGARLEAVSAGPPGAAARRCPAGQPRGWRPAAGVPLVLARRALAPGPVG